MAVLFRSFVDGLYWALAFVLFLWVLDMFSAYRFGEILFTVPGFFLSFLYLFLVVYVLRLPEKWEARERKGSAKTEAKP